MAATQIINATAWGTAPPLTEHPIPTAGPRRDLTAAGASTPGQRCSLSNTFEHTKRPHRSDGETTSTPSRRADASRSYSHPSRYFARAPAAYNVIAVTPPPNLHPDRLKSAGFTWYMVFPAVHVVCFCCVFLASLAPVVYSSSLLQSILADSSAAAGAASVAAEVATTAGA
eukprot:5424812-Pyramimonas_sp.AAC.1